MSNSLSAVHPELIAEWSDKNFPLTPDSVTFGSNKKVWWKGVCGHEWETSVKARSNGEKCPICSGARVIEGINDYPDHPYRVLDDEDMQNLMESISERGVITPAMVRKKDDGRYEMISGHRRKHASERLGLETIRCEVVEVSRDEAIILMVDSNAQRSEILPCDKGKAYKMKLEAIKRQGQRTDLTSDPVGPKLERSNT